MDRRNGRLLVFFSLFLFILGCGGGGGGGGTAAAPGQPDVAAAPNQPEGGSTRAVTDVELSLVLARQVPSAVNLVRFTGLDSQGNILYGPQSRQKASNLLFQSVPIATRVILIEFLQNDTVVGLARIEVSLAEGVLYSIDDPPFEDVEAVLDSLTVRADTTQIAKGTSSSFQAIGLFTDGQSLDLTGSVNWAVSPEGAVVDVDGVVTGMQEGSYLLSASIGGLAAQRQFTVTAAELTELIFQADRFTVAAGTSIDFQVLGIFTDQTVQDLTDQVSLEALFPGVSLGPEPGKLTGLSRGQVGVRATLGGIEIEQTFTVTSAELVTVEIGPSEISLPAGLTQQLTATGHFSDGSTQDLTDSVEWRVDSSSVGSVTPTGLLQAVGVGESTLRVRFQDVEVGSAVFLVTSAELVSLQFDGNSFSLALGTQLQFSVVGTFTDSSTRNMTSEVSLQSQTPGVLDLQSRGQVTGLAQGESRIRASLGQIQTEQVFTVTAAVLTDVALSPVNFQLPVGISRQMTATARFSDGTSQDVTPSVTWLSSSSNFANINSGGLVTGVELGTVEIEALYQGERYLTEVVVVEPILLEVEILTEDDLIVLGAGPLELSVVVRFSDGGVFETDQTSFTSNNPEVAVVNSDGEVSGVSLGEATVKVEVQGMSDEKLVRVRLSRSNLTNLEITPNLVRYAPGAPQKYQVIGTFADSTTKDVTRYVSIRSDNEDVLMGSGPFPGEDPPFAYLTAIDPEITLPSKVTLSAEAEGLQAEAELIVDRLVFASMIHTDKVGVARLATKGDLTLLEERTVGDGPSGIAVSPDGLRLYVSNINEQSIQVFYIEENGALTQESVSTVLTGDQLLFHPSGDYLYTIGRATDKVYFYTFDTEGRPVLEQTLPNDDQPQDLAMTPDGKFLYSGGRIDGRLFSYQIAEDGFLTALDDQETPVNIVTEIVSDPSSDYLYVALAETNTVAIYNISDGGVPSLISSAPQVTGFNALGMDPLGRYLLSGLTTVGLYSLGNDGLLNFQNSLNPGSVFDIEVNSTGKLVCLTDWAEDKIISYLVGNNGTTLEEGDQLQLSGQTNNIVMTP